MVFTHSDDKHLQNWMVKGRDFRILNLAPEGPQKTILGREQMDWLNISCNRKCNFSMNNQFSYYDINFF